MSKAKKTKSKAEFGPKDKVLVTYQTKCYDLVDVPAIIMAANRRAGWQFKCKLVNHETDEVINMGHNDDGGQPGSGPFIYVEKDNLQLVEKYEPKRLTGVVKKANDWKVGDRFTPKEGFDMDQDDYDDITGVVEEMVKMNGQELQVVAIINKLGPTWLVDGRENYCWIPEWVDPIE